LRNGFLTEDERGAFIAHPPAPAYHHSPRRKIGPTTWLR
jgi:hypothetical protein